MGGQEQETVISALWLRRPSSRRSSEHHREGAGWILFTIMLWCTIPARVVIGESACHRTGVWSISLERVSRLALGSCWVRVPRNVRLRCACALPRLRHHVSNSLGRRRTSPTEQTNAENKGSSAGPVCAILGHSQRTSLHNVCTALEHLSYLVCNLGTDVRMIRQLSGQSACQLGRTRRTRYPSGTCM